MVEGPEAIIGEGGRTKNIIDKPVAAAEIRRGERAGFKRVAQEVGDTAVRAEGRPLLLEGIGQKLVDAALRGNPETVDVLGRLRRKERLDGRIRQAILDDVTQGGRTKRAGDRHGRADARRDENRGLLLGRRKLGNKLLLRCELRLGRKLLLRHELGLRRKLRLGRDRLGRKLLLRHELGLRRKLRLGRDRLGRKLLLRHELGLRRELRLGRDRLGRKLLLRHELGLRRELRLGRDRLGRKLLLRHELGLRRNGCGRSAQCVTKLLGLLIG